MFCSRVKKINLFCESGLQQGAAAFTWPSGRTVGLRSGVDFYAQARVPQGINSASLLAHLNWKSAGEYVIFWDFKFHVRSLPSQGQRSVPGVPGECAAILSIAVPAPTPSPMASYTLDNQHCFFMCERSVPVAHAVILLWRNVNVFFQLCPGLESWLT